MATSLRYLLLSVLLMISLLVQSGACGQLDKTIAGPAKYAEDIVDHWSQPMVDNAYRLSLPAPAAPVIHVNYAEDMPDHLSQTALDHAYMYRPPAPAPYQQPPHDPTCICKSECPIAGGHEISHPVNKKPNSNLKVVVLHHQRKLLQHSTEEDPDVIRPVSEHPSKNDEIELPGPQDIDARNNDEGRPLVEHSEGALPVTLPGPDLQHNIDAQLPATMPDISAVTDPTPIGQIIPQQQQGGEPRPVGSYEQPSNETTLGPIATTDDEHNQQEKDAYNLQVSLNLKFLEAEFYLNSVFGKGLEHIAPDLVEGGPLPRGAQKATLDRLTSNIILQFALQEVGHVRAIKKTLGKYFFGRPQLDISKEVFAEFIDKAFGEKLDPPFDVYANPINYFIGVYVIPYIGLTGYVGTSADILTPGYKRRIAGLLAVEAGQDAVTRDYLYERLYKRVIPYTHTIADFTEKISAWRNQLSHDRILDEGLLVKKELGAEKKVQGNVISADEDSLAYGRTPEQVFSTVYNTGDASKPGGFYPLGGQGKIAQQLLKHRPADL